MTGTITGSQESKILLAIKSYFLNTSSSENPSTFHVLFSMPKIIFPPEPFAKATAVLRYFSLSAGISCLNSMFSYSPFFSFSTVISSPP